MLTLSQQLGHARNWDVAQAYRPSRSARRRSQRRRFCSSQREHSHHRFSRQGPFVLSLPIPLANLPRRRSPCGISATSKSSSTPLNRTTTKSSSSPGRPQTKPSLPPPQATAGSTSGTSARLASNRRPRTRRTDRPSSCSCMGATRVARRIWRGARTRIGRSRRRRRIMSCRCGGLARRCIRRTMFRSTSRISSRGCGVQRGLVFCRAGVARGERFDARVLLAFHPFHRLDQPILCSSSCPVPFLPQSR